MSRSTRSKLSPWIERLIQCYGGEGDRSSGQLKAHVTSVGQMTQSQAQGSEGPTWVLFLSDDVVQIPAILTSQAWEHLQDQEDRECCTSLINTSVCIRDYQLQFHMAMEQTKCRFFLSVGKLVSTSAGPVKDSSPCCTILPSVRLKIHRTWRELLSRDTVDSQMSQSGFDLSELLGEWQHDCLQDVVEDVRERLMTVKSQAVSQQPSTSTCIPQLNHQDTFTTTTWDIDRIQYKGESGFSVPIKCLLIPEENALQSTRGSRTLSELPAASEDTRMEHSEATQPSVDEAAWWIAKPAAVETEHHNSSSSVEDMVTGMIDIYEGPSANPWDMFPPPCVSSWSSDEFEDAKPVGSLHSPTAANGTAEMPAIFPSTQLPVHSKEEHSYFPPYQNPPPTNPCSSTSVCVSSLSETLTRPTDLSPTADDHSTHTAQNIPALHEDRQDMNAHVETTCRKAKRKTNREVTPDALSTLVEEEAQIIASPPSWLFDSQAGSGSDRGTCQQAQAGRTHKRKAPSLHSDGKCFSYTYSVSGQNLQDFSQFKMSESLLHWAVKYLLVPTHTVSVHSSSDPC
ncbi:adrenocortical dysplasia protein homolog [Aulostomus maculatus]